MEVPSQTRSSKHGKTSAKSRQTKKDKVSVRNDIMLTLDPRTLHNNGVVYMRGLGVKKNPSEAVRWFRLAAEQGLADAQYELGLCYYKGEGVVKEDVEAMIWLRRAADQGHSNAHLLSLLLTWEKQSEKADSTSRTGTI